MGVELEPCMAPEMDTQGWPNMQTLQITRAAVSVHSRGLIAICKCKQQQERKQWGEATASTNKFEKKNRGKELMLPSEVRRRESLCSKNLSLHRQCLYEFCKGLSSKLIFCTLLLPVTPVVGQTSMLPHLGLHQIALKYMCSTRKVWRIQKFHAVFCKFHAVFVVSAFRCYTPPLFASQWGHAINHFPSSAHKSTVLVRSWQHNWENQRASWFWQGCDVIRSDLEP